MEAKPEKAIRSSELSTNSKKNMNANLINRAKRITFGTAEKKAVIVISEPS
jgi:hypothetical protein